MPLPVVGVHHLELEDLRFETRQTLITDMISRSLNIRRCVAFIGAGLSRAYTPASGVNYPLWSDLPATALSCARTAFRDKNYDEAILDRVGEGSGTPEGRLVTLERIDMACRQSGGDPLLSVYRTELARQFRSRLSPKRPGRDPLKLLMQRLGIRRFLTTNYDTEIEWAFVRSFGCATEFLFPWPQAQEELKSIQTPPSSRPGGATVSEPSTASEIDQREQHLRMIAHAFILNPQHLDDFVQFSLGVPRYEMGVFHCHGVCYDPTSLVLTERDYQRAYLQADSTHNAYREALNVAFAANSVLFVGYSMDDQDLLHRLREYVSERRRDLPDRPLFVLLPSTGKAADEEHWRYLYVRYGVKTYFYPRDTGSFDDPCTRRQKDTAAVCDALEAIAQRWDHWWMEWQLKPSIRNPLFARVPITPKPGDTRDVRLPAKAMVHHYALTDLEDDRIPTETDDWQIETAIQRLDVPIAPGSPLRKRSVLVLGRAGTGKGSLGLRLALDRIRVLGRPYDKRFFATMHFTNELLSTIEAAADFLLDAKERLHSIPDCPWRRFEYALDTGRYLVVLGGLERLLVGTSTVGLSAATKSGGHADPLEVGRPATRDVAELLKIISKFREDRGSHVILTSSIEPAIPELPQFELVRLKGMEADRFVKADDSGISKLWRQIHQALRGHNYALAVLTAAMGDSKEPGVTPHLQRLLRRLTSADLSLRAELAIEAAVGIMEDLGNPAETYLAVMQRFALFSTPVGEAEMVACWPALNSDTMKKQVANAVGVLRERKLVLEIGPEGTSKYCPTPKRYTAHTVVRQYVLHRLGRRIGEIPGELSRLGLSGFSEEKAMPLVPPPRTAVGHRLITETVGNLLGAIESRIEELERDGKGRVDDAGGLDVELRRLVRGAFGLIRARWSANSIPQQTHSEERSSTGLPIGHYRAYHQRLIRLLNAVRSAQENAKLLWAVDEKDWPEPNTVCDDDAILYADELGWLYNELGMVSYAQGVMPDAYAMFRMGQDVNARVERGTRGTRWCQSELNLAGVHIDSANLPRARFHLENAERAAEELEDREMVARVLGYLGLLHHLSGNYHEAHAFYDRAIEQLREQGNRRGLSIFLRHLSDLYRKENRFNEAKTRVTESIVIAESGGHLDLVQYARVAEAHLGLALGDPGARELLEPAVRFAIDAGIPKLEADALKVQANIALESREIELASRLAIRCLGIAGGCGMRLRVTGALVLMGKVAAVRGEWDSAKSLLRSAITMGHEQGYQLQVEAADRELIGIESYHRGMRRKGYGTSERGARG